MAGLFHLLIRLGLLPRLLYLAIQLLLCILYSKNSNVSKEHTLPKTREREIKLNLIRISWEPFVLLKRMQGRLILMSILSL